MCVVKPVEGNCIVISFCACNSVCSSLYGDRRSCTRSPSRFFSSSSSVPLCVQYYRVNTHLFVFGCSARVAWFRPSRSSASVPGRTVKNNQWSAEVCRVAGGCGGLRHAGCDRDSPLRLWLVSQSELRPRGEDWKDSETPKLGELMHRVPDDCNTLQLSSVLFTPSHFSLSPWFAPHDNSYGESWKGSSFETLETVTEISLAKGLFSSFFQTFFTINKQMMSALISSETREGSSLERPVLQNH